MFSEEAAKYCPELKEITANSLYGFNVKASVKLGLGNVIRQHLNSTTLVSKRIHQLSEISTAITKEWPEFIDLTYEFITAHESDVKKLCSEPNTLKDFLQFFRVYA